MLCARSGIGRCQRESGGFSVDADVCESGGVRTFGWPFPFVERSWDDIAEFLAGIASSHEQFTHMANVAESVLSEGAAGTLAGRTSMHDIIVVPRPVPEPPYEVVAVRAPGSLRSPSKGMVLIEHLSLTGRNDVIERPTDEAVALFWRFMIEKFGVQPRGAPRPKA